MDGIGIKLRLTNDVHKMNGAHEKQGPLDGRGVRKLKAVVLLHRRRRTRDRSHFRRRYKKHIDRPKSKLNQSKHAVKGFCRFGRDDKVCRLSLSPHWHWTFAVAWFQHLQQEALEYRDCGRPHIISGRSSEFLEAHFGSLGPISTNGCRFLVAPWHRGG